MIEGATTAVPWTLKRSARTRRLWITVHRDGSVIVTAPIFEPLAGIERFVRAKADWIARAIERTHLHRDDVFLPRDRRSYLRHKEQARTLVRALVAHHAPVVGVRHGRIAVKNMRSNWGSCSEAGNLNFNYKLVLLPPELAEYVVVHELCHLAYFDHSRAFWTLVTRVLPDALARRERMRKYHA